MTNDERLEATVAELKLAMEATVRFVKDLSAQVDDVKAVLTEAQGKNR